MMIYKVYQCTSCYDYGEFVGYEDYKAKYYVSKTRAENDLNERLKEHPNYDPDIEEIETED